MFLKSNSSCLMSNFPADILIIDDERQIRRLLNLTLTGAGYHVRECENGQLGLSETALKRPDAIILDLGLPDINGLEVLKQLREWTQVPILILTAWDREDEKVDALDAGADDYLTKPFKLGVLLSRVNALLRRANASSAGEPVLESGSITVRLLQGQAYKNGILLELTGAEYKLLCFFMQHPNAVLSKEQILDALWDCDGDYIDSSALTVYIRRLRMKIEDNPGKPQMLLTVRGMGYKWNG